MIKQVVYNIVIEADYINVFKDDVSIYKVSIKEKSINLSGLYALMNVEMDDQYSFVNGLAKLEIPQNDSERIFNNVLDFTSHLLGSLNKKLEELRQKQSIADSI